MSVHDLEPASRARQLPPVIQGGMGVGVSSWRLARQVAQQRGPRRHQRRRLRPAGRPLAPGRRPRGSRPEPPWPSTPTRTSSPPPSSVSTGRAGREPGAPFRPHPTAGPPPAARCRSTRGARRLRPGARWPSRDTTARSASTCSRRSSSGRRPPSTARCSPTSTSSSSVQAFPRTSRACSTTSPTAAPSRCRSTSPGRSPPTSWSSRSTRTQSFRLRRQRCRVRSSSRSSPRTSSVRTWRATTARVLTASSSKAPPPAGTTPRRDAWSSTRAASRSTAPRDVVDLDKLAKVGLPYWLAGGQASPKHVVAARAGGAQGVQIGTVFALCHESGLHRAVAHCAAECRWTPEPPRCAPTPGRARRASRSRSCRWPAPSPTLRSRHQARAHLRPRLPAYAVPPRRRHDRSALSGRADRCLRAQGRGRRGHRGPQVPVQRADGVRGRPADPPRRRRPSLRCSLSARTSRLCTPCWRCSPTAGQRPT